MSRHDLEEAFRRAVEAHDVTYAYSDDGAVYRRGKAEREEIERLAAGLDRAVAVAIWNRAMDKKFLNGKIFYWEGWTTAGKNSKPRPRRPRTGIRT